MTDHLHAVTFLAVHDWGRHQHYRDRAPSWVKLHVNTDNNYAFTLLSLADRGLLAEMYKLAAKLDNEIPYDLRYIIKRCSLVDQPRTVRRALNVLIAGGFLDESLIQAGSGAIVLAEAEQDGTDSSARVRPRAGGEPRETSTETEKNLILAASPPDDELKPRRERQRDLEFEALLEVVEWDVAQLTKPARATVNTALRDLKAVGASPSDILRRGARFRLEYPNATLTPAALAKHWAGLGATAAMPKGGGLSVEQIIDFYDEEGTP